MEVLRYGCLAEPTTFDPLAMQDRASLKIAAQVPEGLAAWQPGRDAPGLGLADAVDKMVDRPEWSLRLRAGIQFHDGALLDAEALVASSMRHVA